MRHPLPHVICTGPASCHLHGTCPLMRLHVICMCTLSTRHLHTHVRCATSAHSCHVHGVCFMPSTHHPHAHARCVTSTHLCHPNGSCSLMPSAWSLHVHVVCMFTQSTRHLHAHERCTVSAHSCHLHGICSLMSPALYLHVHVIYTNLSMTSTLMPSVSHTCTVAIYVT